jgi:aminoglycoside 3-N-acetyltransferase
MFVPTLTATFAASPWVDLNKYAFDPKETPSRVGKITDTFWRRPEACRSEHPTHSLAAIGRNAGELVKGHGRDASTFDRRGPYGKYVKLGAKVCFVGTSLRCNTTLHVAEDWAEMPYMDQHSKALVKEGGKEIAVPLRNSPNGHRSFYAGDDESPAVKLFYGLGLVKEAKLGDAKVQLIGAQDIINAMMRTFHGGEPGFLLCKKTDCEFCRKGREACERELPRIRKTIEHLAADGWCRI